MDELITQAMAEITRAITGEEQEEGPSIKDQLDTAGFLNMDFLA